MISLTRKALFAAICATAVSTAVMAKPHDNSQAYFNRIATYPVFLNLDAEEDPAQETVSEIITVTSDKNTLIYTDSPGERVGFVNIVNPANPIGMGFIPLHGEPTSVTVVGKYALVAVNTSADYVDTSGELVVIDTTLPVNEDAIVITLSLLGQPDSVAVSPDKQYAAVVIENERDEDFNDGEIPQLPAGLLQIVDLQGEPVNWGIRDVDLTGYAALAGTDPEPEFVDISDNNFAVVTLQENNHLLVVHLPSGAVSTSVDAGTVNLTAIDTNEDDFINPVDSLFDVPREPDAVTWMGKNRFATANEGDYQGGSRGFTIFNKDGAIKFDSGNSYEHLAIRHGHYPEDRSENKGSEPEGIEYGVYGNEGYLFVGSERGNFVAVYKDSHPNRPQYHQFLPATPGPEGLLAIPERNLFVTASEVDDEGAGIRASIGIYELQDGAPTYPSIKSTESDLIPWSALSGLAADINDAHKLYTIRDSFYKKSAFYSVDVSSMPAVITEQRFLMDNGDLDALGMANNDGTVNLDLEGVTMAADGNFWFASEGAGASTTPNLLIHSNSTGQIQQVVHLPAEVNALQVSNGFEGVAPVNAMVEGQLQTTALLVAFQRNWVNDPANMRRIGKYDLGSGEWTFAYYPAETPAKGWAGLSEITAVGGSQFAVIERDNQLGLDADVNDLKRVYQFDIANVTFAAQGEAFPVLSKSLLVNMLPLMQATHGTTPDKLEGFAKAVDGACYAVTDNDGLDDAYGETLFMTVPCNQ